MPGYTQTGDPIADEPVARRTGCPRGGRCDGTGWVQVTPAGAAAMHPDPPPPDLDMTEAELAEHALFCRRAAAARKSAETSVYPCKDCNADRFYRWAGGHYKPNHTCPECVIAKGATKVRRT